MDFITEVELKRKAVPMAVSEDFILQSLSYNTYVKQGLSQKDAITRCLKELGGNTNDVVRNVGLVRCNQKKDLAFQGGVYILFTTDNCKFKHFWEHVSCLNPDHIPRGKTIIHITDLGEDEEDYRSDEEKQEMKILEKDKRVPRTPTRKE